MPMVRARGVAGILVRGAQGAGRLKELLFPVQASRRLDVALSTVYAKLRMYMSKEPLVLPAKFDLDNTNVQVPMAPGCCEVSSASAPLPEAHSSLPISAEHLLDRRRFADIFGACAAGLAEPPSQGLQAEPAPPRLQGRGQSKRWACRFGFVDLSQEWCLDLRPCCRPRH
mmetsp:Transcript_35069/g.81421  ORF Transcript_35069/g.81421 Transcript_35069/m.81421 type:complete len:170 (-) Transcript_35069:101-610(-)